MFGKQCFFPSQAFSPKGYLNITTRAALLEALCSKVEDAFDIVCTETGILINPTMKGKGCSDKEKFFFMVNLELPNKNKV